VDSHAFEEAASTARRSRDPAIFWAATDLYAGDLLPEDRYEEWAEGKRAELRQLYLALIMELASLYEGREEHAPAIEVLRRVISEEPTLEEAHASLMHLYARSGRFERAWPNTNTYATSSRGVQARSLPRRRAACATR
jgi:DNA-binding SARP family transcriptional activator